MAIPPRLVLASQSPRRLALLAQIGVSADPRPADIDETPFAQESPGDYVLRLAREKALACQPVALDEVVLAADTAVVVGKRILGKPEDRRHAAAMLALLSGRSHQVMTAVALRRGELVESLLVVTEVSFGPLSEAQIQAYLASGEADDKAGAYGIQGIAAQFVSRINGSYSAVVGLPLFEVAAKLREWGLLQSGPMRG